MENATIPPQIQRDDVTSESGDSSVLWTALIATVVVCVLLVAVVFAYAHRRGIVTTLSNDHSEKEETELVEEGLGSSEIVTTTSSGRALHVASTGATTISNSSARESPFLDPEKTWSKAEFFFPGLVEGTNLVSVERKWCRRKKGLDNANAAIRAELIEKLHQKVRDLSRPMDDKAVQAKWEYLNKKEHAAELCVALGMDSKVVNIRFQLIENLELVFPSLKTHKTPILHSIHHLINTLHVVNNPFGEDKDMDEKIHENYRGKEWLSYLGVQWGTPPGFIEKVEKVQSIMNERFVFKNGFFVHGTAANILKAIEKEDGRLLLSGKSDSDKHDFGPGFYCFKNEYLLALSFAVDRCWPTISEDKDGTPIVASCNPSIILFPEHDHTIFSANNKNKSKKICGPPIKQEELKDLVMEDKRDEVEFEKCRTKWKDDKELGYWKDFVKLQLAYGPPVMPSSAQGYSVFYGRMHSCDHENLRPTGDRVPFVDENGWEQYCFRATKHLGTKQIFIEFNLDWNQFLKRGTKFDDAGPQIDTAKKDIDNILVEAGTK